MIGQNSHLNRFTDFVTAMIHGIDKGLFQGLERIVEKTIRLGPVRMLDNDLLNQNSMQVAKSFFQHAV
ncbi:hypothetical protein ES703_119929 [subsurface metagenome]